MRAKPFVIFLFAVSTAIGGFALLNLRQGDASIPKEQILAATMELPAGTLLRAQDITWQPVSVIEADQIVHPAAAAIEAKPEIVEETAARVYGAVLRHPLASGEPIRRGDIVKPGDRDFLQVVLIPGERAISIPVATGGASTGLLSPGDRVDVILTQNFKNDTNQELKDTPITRRSVGETIVQNLRVLAIDALDPKATMSNPANGNFGRTVTLEVTPDQAEVINVATELGKLSLTLRNVATVSAAVDPIRPKWAGDVSPALMGAAPEKPIALKKLPVLILRGGKTTDKELRSELIKPESDTKEDKNR